MNRQIIIVGVLLVVVGLAWPWLSKIPLGRLPGDLLIEGDNLSFYFPLTTALLVSVIARGLVWLLHK